MNTELEPEKVELSVLITVASSTGAAVLKELYTECVEELSGTDLGYEFVFVVEKEDPDVMEELLRLREKSEPAVRILVLGRHYGSATALSVGVEHAAGEAVLTIPAYLRVESGALVSLVSEMRHQNGQRRDLVILKRNERRSGVIGKAVDKLLRFPLRLALGQTAYDTRRSVLLFRKEVVQSIEIFGDKDRYLPILAHRLGFDVSIAEEGRAEPRDGHKTGFSVHEEVSQFLDLLSVFFLTEFTQKPLRFFGFFGLTSLSGGLLICFYLTVQRFFMGVPLADKPMLLLGVLLIVLGVLLLSIGLIGEMVIFTNGKSGPKSNVEETVN